METVMSKIDYEGEEIAFNRLEICNYRHLQGLAKQMGLPSNVKKVELIEMIRAKKYCSETDLQIIVNRIKMERKVIAQTKRKKQKKKTIRLQGTEVSSTSQSPPISMTPKRPSDYVIQYSPENHKAIMKYYPRPSVVQAGAPYLQASKRGTESDRILRSFNSLKRPNYRIMDQSDCVIGVVKSRNTMKEVRQERVQEIHQERIQEIHQERAFQTVNVTIQKQRPVNALMLNSDRQLVPVISRSLNTGPNPVKRQRKLSGIYPIKAQEEPQYKYMPTVNLRQTDGRVTKINAVIQRPLAKSLLPSNHTFLQNKSLIRRNATANAIPRPIVVTVQDVINYKVDHPTLDLTSPRAIEPNTVDEIDQSNEIVRQMHDQQYVYNQQVQPVNKSSLIERQMEDYESNTNWQHEHDNANNVKLSYKGRTLVNIVPERDPNRKVYKNRQNSNTRNEWSYETDQETEVKNKKEWYIYDINNKSLDTTDGGSSQCFRRKPNECRRQAPVLTNNKVVQRIISAPMSREQKFGQEIRDRNIEHARNVDYARNTDLSRNVDLSNHMEYTRSAEHNLNMENYARHEDHSSNIDYARNTDLARSYTEQIRFDHVRNIDQNMTLTRNMRIATKSEFPIYQRTRILDSERRIDYSRNMDHARNAEHARNADIRALESAKIETDLRNQYPNMSSLTDVLPKDVYTQEADTENNYSVYYHKKIRADQGKSNAVERLPKINDVFSQFNDDVYKKLSQPLYVKVSEESERVPMLMKTNNVNNTCLLESFYNFKSEFITNPPVLQIAMPKTQCTFSTRTVPTAVAQPAASELSNHWNPHEQASPYQSRFYEYGKPEGQLDVGCDEVMSSPTVTVETPTSQELGANVTIPSPEMVEDALELISQDGDYMERIGMDVRVQCILCSEWAGPKFILEYHLKNEHPREIQVVQSPEARVAVPLAPAASAWSSRLLQHRDALYALSAHWARGSVLLALSAIPNELEIPRRGRITVYNKRSGKPFSYEGDIKPIPDSMPYEYGHECLVLDVASLDLMPNSANLKLVNRELVGSPGKVVVGQPDLNSVEMDVYIKLLD